MKSNLQKISFNVFLTILMLSNLNNLFAQISVVNGSTLSQDFDGIGSTSTATLPLNWKMSPPATASPTWSAVGNVTATLQQASSGAPTTGSRYNWGNGTTTTDRAIGFMTSGGYANLNSIMAFYQNNSGAQMNNVTLTFDYERYRINTAACSVSFFTSTDGAIWTAQSAGDSGAFATGTSAYNFITGTVVSKSFTLTGINIPNGGNLYLRWYFNTTGGNSQGVGIDNVTFTPTLAPLTPIVTTTAATSISATSATLNATINANNNATDTSFDYGTTIGYGTNVAATPPTLSGVTPTAVSETISPLTVNTQYNFRGVGSVSGSPTNGNNLTFYTLANVPLIPDPAAVITTTSIDIFFVEFFNNPQNTQFAIQINGGSYVQADGSLGATAVWQTEGQWVILPVPHFITITGLTPNTLYNYAIKARNGDNVETAFGPSQSATTLPITAPTLSAGTLTGFGNVCINTISSANSFSLLGDFLISNITVGPLTGFTFFNSLTSTYDNSLTFTPDINGDVSETVLVKFTPIITGSYNGNIPVSGGGATAINVLASGNGIDTAVVVTTNPSTLVTASSATISGSSVLGCSSLISFGMEYSLTNDFAIATSFANFSEALIGLLPNTQYFHRAFATDGTGLVYGNTLDFTTQNLAIPQSNPATLIQQNEFTANWDMVSGATSYRLDVSTTPSFVTITNTTDLLISEYFEGSASNKYIEIYNGTGTAVNLADYQLRLYSNGAASPSTTQVLSGTLANGSTIVYRNSGAGIYLGTSTIGTAVNYNGDDAVALFKISTSSFVDIFGRIGEDPGTAWTAPGFSTLDKTLIRKPTVFSGVTVNPVAGFPTLSTEWIQFNVDSVANLGAHAINNSTPNFVVGYENLQVNALLQQVTGLTPNTEYYYRVRAESATSTSGNSGVIAVLTLPSQPSAIVGNASACENSSQVYSVTNMPGLTYAWTLPVGMTGSSTTNSITITNVANGGTISVVPSNASGSGPSQSLLITTVAPVTLYADSDNDGFGDPTVSIFDCPQAGYVIDNTDCDDTIMAINPGQLEVLYNGVDDNCDGNLDEGFQLKTKVLPAQCGATLATLGSLIGVTTLAAPNITGYRFKVTNGASVQTLERTVPNFSLTMLPISDYATTYTVEVELQRSGVWLGYYGDACLVSTPAILASNGAAQVSPSQCGITLPSISTLIATTSLAGVTGYRFKITRSGDVGPNAVQTIDRPLHWFSLPMLTQYNYGSAYTVEVAVKTTGAYSGYGNPCVVSSPASPSLVICGGTVATAGTLVYCQSLNLATQYRFQITRLSDNTIVTVDRNLNWFTFNQIPGYTTGAQYSVRVAVQTISTWSEFGDACEITAPGVLAPRFAPSTPSVAEFKAVASPNPFAADFKLELTSSSEELVQVKVYDMIGKLIEFREVKVSDLSTQEVGSAYPSGVYNIIVTQGVNVKTLRVIKR